MITNSKGVTLLEMMLVLAIIAAILVVGLRVYRYMQLQSEVAIVKQNVDDLLLAMKLYYQSDCGLHLTSDGKRVPTYTFVGLAGDGFRLNVDLELKGAGYLNANWPRRTNLAKGYYAAFIKAIPFSLKSQQDRSIPPDPACTTNCNSIPIKASSKYGIAGTVYTYIIQVSIKVDNNNTAATYFGALGATCITKMGNNNFIFPCRSTVPENYLSWERLPSSFEATSGSQLWPSLQRAKQFNNAVILNDDFYALQVNDSDYNKTTGYEYYLCGS